MNELAESQEAAAGTPIVSVLSHAESVRAVQQVQAAYIMARKFPRDSNAALLRIISACQRFGLAERAFYSFPRAKETITGGSIRLAEVLAQSWGNIDCGVVELERSKGASVVESYCLDLETNYRQKKTWEVSHEIQLRGGAMKKLTDPRDIYEHVANNAARRLRAVIFAVIPIDIREAAEKQCRQTLVKGEPGSTLEERIRRLLVGFKGLGVNQAMIEARLGHQIDLMTGEELVDYGAIFNTIRDKQAPRAKFFSFPEDGPAEGKAAELAAKIHSPAPGGAE